MGDTAIAVGAAFFTCVIGIMGAYVTFKPPEFKREKFWWLMAFLACAIIGSVLVGWQTIRNGRQQEALNTSIGSVRDNLQKSETGREVDNAYLKAKLEDYKSLQELAPALMRVAQASEDYTKKQYEVKVISSAELLSFTKDVVAKIRVLGSKCKAQEQAAFQEQPVDRVNVGAMTADQRDQFFRERSQKRQQAFMQNRFNCEQAYRSQFLGDAAYARRELLNKLGGNKFPLPGEEMKASAIDGLFAGVDPIDDSAEYLDALSHKLQEQSPKQPK